MIIYNSMEESYQILRNGQEGHYVVVRKDHPGFLANVIMVDDVMHISKITLMENCQLSSLVDSLKEIEYYFTEEEFQKKIMASEI